MLFYYDYGLVGIGFYFVGVGVSPHLQEIELPAFKMSTHHCCSPSVLLTTVSAGCHSFCVKRDCYRKKLTLCFFLCSRSADFHATSQTILTFSAVAGLCLAALICSPHLPDLQPPSLHSTDSHALRTQPPHPDLPPSLLL